MFSYLYLNPIKYDKTQRKEKIKKLSVNNIIFKNGFNGFNYNYFKKEELFKKENINNFKIFLESIKIPVYEVLGYDIPTKFYLDCEMENISADLFNKKDEIFINFDKYLLKFLNNKFPQKEKEILYADSSRLKNDNYKLSIHVIVNNLGFFNRNYLKKLILEFIETLPKDVFLKNGKSFVDESVYKGSQLMRIILSHNLSKDSLLKPFIIINNKIVYKDIEFIAKDYEKSLCGKYIESNEDIIESNEEYDKNTENKESKKNIYNDVKIPDWKINWIKNNNYVKNIYKIDNIEKKIINLRRINFNAYCQLCKRNHTNDNAYCKINKNNIIFYCNRNKKGISIGSWYEKKDKISKMPVDNSDELINLKTENDRLKQKIIILENKINSLNTFNKIEISKYSTKECKNKGKNIFYKYYEAGLSLINNNIDEFNKIIKDNFKCVNISLLKNRSLRIYKLYKYKKENNLGDIKCSLRNIFNTPNFKFDENLKNNIYFIN